MYALYTAVALVGLVVLWLPVALVRRADARRAAQRAGATGARGAE